jgi:hypothetical protein
VILFIGGPWDGQLRDVKEDAYRVMQAEPIPYVDTPQLVRNTIYMYTRRKLWFEGNAQLQFFALSETTTAEAVVQVFSKYAEKVKHEQQQRRFVVTTTRSEHLEWCKKRAIEYCQMGDIRQAFASMGSDLNKHPDTRHHPAIGIGFKMMISGLLDDPQEMEKFIKGFH